MNFATKDMKTICTALLFILIIDYSRLMGEVSERLVEAVNLDDTAVVAELVSTEDLNLNGYFSQDGFHLLSIALRNNDVEMFKMLLMGGADPNAKSSEASNLSVGARILDAPMREAFLIEALNFGLNPNLKTVPHIGSEGELPLLFRTAEHAYQLSYFVILINSGAHLESDSDWLQLFKRALLSDNFRMAWYLLATDKIDLNALEGKKWWYTFKKEEGDVFVQNVAYWRNALVNEAEAKNGEANLP